MQGTKIVVSVTKSKSAKGLPKRTGRRGAKHGAGSNRTPGKKRDRGKVPGFRGVAICIGGCHVELVNGVQHV